MKDIDFLPDRICVQRARRRRLTVQGYMLAACMVGLCVLGFVLQGRVAQAQEELGLLSSRTGGIERQLRLREDMESQLGDLMIKKRIEEQLGRRVGTLDVLGELQRVMPESMTLITLTMETVEVQEEIKPAEGAGASARARARNGLGASYRTVKRVRLLLTGMAPTDVDVANFIGLLAASPVFEDVNMGYARNITFRSRDARKFQASCFLAR